MTIAGHDTIWIFDNHSFRRASLAALVRPWAKQSGIALHETDDPGQIRRAPATDDSAGRTAVLAQLGEQDSCAPAIERQLRALQTGDDGCIVVLLSDRVTRENLTYAMDQGFQGLIPTSMDVPVALAALQFILAGGIYFPHVVTEAALDGLSRVPAATRAVGVAPSVHETIGAPNSGAGTPSDPRREAAPDLTPRQADVLAALQRGETNKAIARSLNLSEATVKIHVRHLMRKFDVHNRTQVALCAQMPAAASHASRVAE